MHVLGKVVRVVEVDDALVVGLHYLGGEQLAHREVLGDLAGHVVALTETTVGFLLEFSCLTSSLLHSMSARILSSVVFLWRFWFCT